MIQNNKEYPHSELTGDIIRCALEVHKFLGNGFQEVIYQRALALEFNLTKLDYARELEMFIYYKSHIEEIGTRRVDFLVDGTVVVELKTISNLENVHLAQILNYLKAYRKPVGLLLNFGSKSLEIKRVVRQIS